MLPDLPPLVSRDVQTFDLGEFVRSTKASGKTGRTPEKQKQKRVFVEDRGTDAFSFDEEGYAEEGSTWMNKRDAIDHYTE